VEARPGGSKQIGLDAGGMVAFAVRDPSVCVAGGIRQGEAMAVSGPPREACDRGRPLFSHAYNLLNSADPKGGQFP